MKRMYRFLMGIGINFLFLIPVIALPQLIRNGTLTLAEGFLIVELIILLLSYLLVRTLPGKGRAGLKVKAGAAVFTFVSAIVIPLMYLTTVKTPPNWFLILIPINVVILAVPAYLYYVNGKAPNLSGAVLNDNYTSMLHEMFPESRETGHEVYMSSRLNMRNFASTTNGKDWKITLTSDAPGELTEGEIRMLLAETYTSRKKNVALRLVALAAFLVAIYIDLLIAMPVLKGMYPPLSMEFLAVVIASFALLLSLPFYIFALFSRSTIKIDRSIARKFGNPADLKGLIRKTSEIRVPPSSLSSSQLDRYNRRKERTLSRRFEAIENAGTN